MAASAWLSTAVLLPDDRTRVVAPPTLKAAELESSHGVERVDDDGHPLVADGARTVGGVGGCHIVPRGVLGAG